eukprot:CAMPEP_0116876928 /NCGR_PEP_ID=MMETSP0463-20121206/8781_1 /TAXON_ID=181622 /ORGANISM="Strombidinopsis sp, Strain SopsisLIS2011" /LENGTH=139 /DNA_ID=CAMNT_0004523845 /DNA_START=66 /DNA_END=485 /DNA_ORIENTATION=+
MHDAQEAVAVPLNTDGYALEMWAVTGKASRESQDIDTWFVGLELTTPKGQSVVSSDADADDLGTEDSLTYVGMDGGVMFTFAQFTVPNGVSGSEFESFSCSKMLTVTSESKEFVYTNDEGYEDTKNEVVTEEVVSEAMI